MAKLPAWIKRTWSSVAPYSPMKGGREHLERQYARGTWDYLAGITELGRFSVMVGYCHFLNDRARILELGCGEGLLAARLCPTRFEAYTGVDISTQAVERARARGLERATFFDADALTFEPEGRFDLILFTECLEYFADPLALVRRYEPFLVPGGHFLVSMFVGTDTRRTSRIWRMLGTRFRCLDETRISNSKNQSWIVRVLQPPAG